MGLCVLLAMRAWAAEKTRPVGAVLVASIKESETATVADCRVTLSTIWSDDTTCFGGHGATLLFRCPGTPAEQSWHARANENIRVGRFSVSLSAIHYGLEGSGSVELRASEVSKPPR